MSIETVIGGASTDFMFDRHAETMPRQAISALQTSRLKQTLECAYANVAHYRKKFDAAGVRPRDFGSLADITKFPFTLKSDLRDNYPFGMFAVPREKLRRLHASSGTTGKPTVVGYTKSDLDLWSDLMARSLACAGANPAISSTTLTDTDYSRAALGFIMALSASVARSCRSREEGPSGK